MAFAYVATVPSAMVFSGFFFLDFFFQNRPHPKKKNFFFFGENFCDVEKKNFFWARQRDKWHFVARLESLVALVALDPARFTLSCVVRQEDGKTPERKHTTPTPNALTQTPKPTTTQNTFRV